MPSASVALRSSDGLSPLDPFPVLAVDSHDAAVVRAFIKVVAFDLARVEDEFPDVVAMVVARTYTVQSAFCVLVEVFEFVAYDIVKRIPNLLFKFFWNLLLQIFQRFT